MTTPYKSTPFQRTALRLVAILADNVLAAVGYRDLEETVDEVHDMVAQDPECSWMIFEAYQNAFRNEDRLSVADVLALYDDPSIETQTLITDAYLTARGTGADME